MATSCTSEALSGSFSRSLSLNNTPGGVEVANSSVRTKKIRSSEVWKATRLLPNEVRLKAVPSMPWISTVSSNSFVAMLYVCSVCTLPLVVNENSKPCAASNTKFSPPVNVPTWLYVDRSKISPSLLYNFPPATLIVSTSNPVSGLPAGALGSLRIPLASTIQVAKSKLVTVF